MGNLFGSFQDVPPQNKHKTADTIMAYEESYMKLLKRYRDEIHDIEEMMEQLRKERQDFYMVKLPSIKKEILEDDIVSKEVCEQWLIEIQRNMEQSFQISESLIAHYVTKNLEEFKLELKQELNKV